MASNMASTPYVVKASFGRAGGGRGSVVRLDRPYRETVTRKKVAGMFVPPFVLRFCASAICTRIWDTWLIIQKIWHKRLI
jgi:hypothetical protein